MTCVSSLFLEYFMNLNAISVIILNSVLASTAAMAQTKAPEPDFTLSYNVGVTSDYRFRGIAQTSTDPALQAGVDFAHKSGFYLGAWGSNISWIKDYVFDPADVRTPGAEVKTALVRKVHARLQGRVGRCLGDTPKAVVAGDTDVVGQ